MAALRMRVSMSETGSVIMGSPARLDHAGDFSLEREKSQANTTELEVAVVAACAAANLAPAGAARRKLRSTIELCELTGSSHFCLSAVRGCLSNGPEGHAELGEERSPLVIG